MEIEIGSRVKIVNVKGVFGAMEEKFNFFVGQTGVVKEKLDGNLNYFVTNLSNSEQGTNLYLNFENLEIIK
jgi:hypothetical protein